MFNLLKFLVILLLFPLHAQAEASAIAGLWMTKKKDAVVRIEPCGNLICGWIEWTKPTIASVNSKGQSLCHAKVLSGFRQDAADPNHWVDGTIYQIVREKNYKGELHLQNPNKLELRGYIGLPVMGKTKIMTRVPENFVQSCEKLKS